MPWSQSGSLSTYHPVTLSNYLTSTKASYGMFSDKALVTALIASIAFTTGGILILILADVD